MSRIALVVEGGTDGPKEILLSPLQDTSLLTVFSGTYVLSAKALQGDDLVLFESASTTLTLVKGDTLTARLEMVAALGEVTLEVGGQTEGVIQVTAGDSTPFIVAVKNTQGRPVPNALVRLRATTHDMSTIVLHEDRTGDDGTARGAVVSSRRGTLAGFMLDVDGRAMEMPQDLRIDFGTAVHAGQSSITVDVEQIPADGLARSSFMVEVRDADGDPLPGVDVTVLSNRNAGEDAEIDIIEPASGTTDSQGVFFFTVRTRTSSFLRLGDDGRLVSGTAADPVTFAIVAEDVLIGLRELIAIPTVDSNFATLRAGPFELPADGHSRATIEVTVKKLPQFGPSPPNGVFIEIIDAGNNQLNYQLDITSDPGFEGFRTNAEGVWRGSIGSSTPLNVFFWAKADGRFLVLKQPAFILFK